jgi:hypothetical protein
LFLPELQVCKLKVGVPAEAEVPEKLVPGRVMMAAEVVVVGIF